MTMHGSVRSAAPRAPPGGQHDAWHALSVDEALEPAGGRPSTRA